MEQINKNENIIKRWYKLCQPNKTAWTLQILCYIIYAVIYASMTIFAAKTINCLYNANWQGAFFWLGIELLDIVLRNYILHLEYKCYCKVYSSIRLNITKKIYDKIFNSDEKHLKKLSTEKIINIAQNNMGEACEFPEYIANTLSYLVQVIIAIVTIYISNWFAGLIVTVLGVINFFVYRYFNVKLGKLLKKRYETKDNSFKEYSNILSGKNVIEELDAKEDYKNKLLGHIDDFNKEYKKYYINSSYQNNLYYIVWNIVVYSITALLIYFVTQGSLELGIYLIIVPYLTSCTEKLNTLYSKFGGVEKVRVDVDRINLILSLNEKQMIQYGNVNKMCEGYNLGFIDVSVNAANVQLKNIDISFKMNAVNIIKGERGSGKRAIFDMLRRRIKPNSGEVLLDNLNLYDYNVKTFKNHIDYCSSHPIFINGTVKENLLIANNDFNFITSQVQELGLEKVINSLPYGYDTNISDITEEESRFWIGVIRASLSKCKILMIYEYPEKVSPDFSTILQNIISTCEIDKRTLIVFTHNDSYDNLAQAIYEIKNGKVKLEKIKNKNAR